VKHKESSGHQAKPGGSVVPAHVAAEVESGENSKNRKRDNLLDHLELDRREAAVSKAVGRDLEAIFEEGDAPAEEDDLPKRLLSKFQMTVPGDGHKNIGEDEKHDGPHFQIVCG